MYEIMYQRFKRGLFIPSELSIYLKDSWLKVWVYFFLLLLLSSLPFLMVNFGSSGLPHQHKIAIKEQYVEELSGTHKIVDGILVIEPQNLSHDRYLRVDIYTIGIVNTPTSTAYQGIRLIFVTDGVRLTTFNLPTQTYSYDELGINNFDFSDYSPQNIDRLIRAVNYITEDHNASIKVFQTVGTLGSTFIELIFFVLISAVFSRHLVPFKYKFKMAVYVLTVYVVLSLFALFLNNGLFIFIGIILMMIYMRRAFMKLTMI